MVIFEKHNLSKYLKGKGIEIGALNSQQRVDRKKCQVKYVDWLNREGLIKHNPTIPPESIKEPDIVANAMDLGVIADGSVDFVIANQMLEHLPNPIKALKEFYRVLKTGGILYLSIPDKRYTFDKERPLTPLSHLVDDYKKDVSSESDMSHYEEWVKLVEEKRPPNSPLRWNLENILSTGCAIHFHVWTPESFIETLNYMKNDLKTPFSLKNYYYRDKESPFIFILEKVPPHPFSDINASIKEKYSVLRLILSKAEYKLKSIIMNTVIYKNIKSRTTHKLPKVNSIVYEVTDACNSHCLHCNIWKQKPTKNLLTPEEVETLLKDDFFSELKNILLTGGEITIRNDVKELLTAIYRARPCAQISFSTNAILAEKVLDITKYAIEKEIPLKFGISLDAASEKHDLIRGAPGNFKKADFLIKELIKLREKHSNIIKGISVGHTLSNLTIDTVEEVMDYAKKLGIKFSTQLYEEFPYYYNTGDRGKEELLEDYKRGDNRLLIDKVKSLPLSFHHEMLLKLLKGGFKFRCFAMRTFFVLKCNGSIAPCLNLCNVKVGNIREIPINELWNSASALKAHKIVDKCQGCSNTWGYGWSYKEWPFSFWKIIIGLKIKRLLARIKKG